MKLQVRRAGHCFMLKAHSVSDLVKLRFLQMVGAYSLVHLDGQHQTLLKDVTEQLRGETFS